MTLYRIESTHYSPKDSHTAVDAFVLAPSEEAVARWLDAEKLYGGMSEPPEDGDNDPEATWSPADCSEEEKARAVALGLTVSTAYGIVDIEGPRWPMFLFCRGDHFQEVEDLYYGATQWAWVAVEGGEDVARAVAACMGPDRFVMVDADGKVSE